MDTKLKIHYCPWCRSLDCFLMYNKYSDLYWVECPGCSAQSPHKNSAIVIDLWNESSPLADRQRQLENERTDSRPLGTDKFR